MLRSLKKTANITVKLPIGSLGTLLIKTLWANRYDFIIKTTVLLFTPTRLYRLRPFSLKNDTVPLLIINVDTACSRVGLQRSSKVRKDSLPRGQGKNYSYGHTTDVLPR